MSRPKVSAQRLIAAGALLLTAGIGGPALLSLIQPPAERTDLDLLTRQDVQASLTGLEPLLLRGTELGDRLDSQLWINWAEVTELPAVDLTDNGLPIRPWRLRYRAEKLVDLSGAQGAGTPRVLASSHPADAAAPGPWPDPPRAEPGEGVHRLLSRPAERGTRCKEMGWRDVRPIQRRWTQRTSTLLGPERPIEPVDYEVSAWVWTSPPPEGPSGAVCLRLDVNETVTPPKLPSGVPYRGRTQDDPARPVRQTSKELSSLSELSDRSAP